MTRRRPGTHLEEALRVGTWPPPPPAPALRNPPPPPPPAALDEAALAMMLRPVRLRQEELEKEICSICHSFLRNGRATRLVPCGHAFHIDCVRRWLLIRGDCPMCRGLPYRQKPDVGGGKNGGEGGGKRGGDSGRGRLVGRMAGCRKERRKKGGRKEEERRIDKKNR